MYYFYLNFYARKKCVPFFTKSPASFLIRPCSCPREAPSLACHQLQPACHTSCALHHRHPTRNAKHHLVRHLLQPTMPHLFCLECTICSCLQCALCAAPSAAAPSAAACAPSARNAPSEALSAPACIAPSATPEWKKSIKKNHKEITNITPHQHHL